jgi:hypothetical protein
LAKLAELARIKQEEEEKAAAELAEK